MSKNIFNNSTEKVIIRNASVKSLILNAILTGATNNVAITQPALDLAKVLVKIIARIGGQTITIYEGLAKPVVYDSALMQGTFTSVNSNHASFDHLTLLAEGASNKELAVMPSRIDFCNDDEVITVKGNDEWIMAEIKVQNGAFDATADQSLSYVDAYFEEGVGYMLTVPIMEVETITTDQSSPEYPLGDNVTNVNFINYDKNGITSAVTPIVDVTVSSDRLNFTKDYNRLLADRLEANMTLAEANDRDQNFTLLKRTGTNPEFDNVTIRMNLTLGNVTASSNFIVTRKYVTTPHIIAKAQERRGRHSRKLKRKVMGGFRGK